MGDQQSQYQSSESDAWSRWLLNRSGGDAAYAQTLTQGLNAMRDRVLDGAQLRPDNTLLDIGSGDGLIPFGALDRIGDSLTAIFTDVSAPMLKYAKQIATQRGLTSQCQFYECSADDLVHIWDCSVNVITSRASIAFVANKPAAFAEFFRSLRPGGRISLCEPILQDEAFETMMIARLIESQPTLPNIESLRLIHRFKSMQLPACENAIAQNPLTNFCERDLVGMARDAGFAEIHLELHIDVLPSLKNSWEVFLNTSPHPWCATSREILAQHFSEHEQNLFEHMMRPAIESSKSIAKDTFAYLTAIKPLA